MQLLNKTTGMVEYIGSVKNFLGVDAYRHPDVAAEFEIQLSEAEKRDLLRQDITDKAGDTESLLGTTNDGMQFVLHSFFKLVTALNAANSLAEVRAAAEPFNAIATSFLSKVESGDVALPFQAKGVDAVMTEIEERATAVASVLESKQEVQS